jgi:pimeloyl-ACP methyl ester carboxylesterase
VVLQREVELPPVRISFREWPGHAGPLVHLADADTSRPVIDALAGALAPRYRILSLPPAPGVVPAVRAAHVAELLDQFGFSNVILIGEGIGALAALQVAECYPGRAAGVLLIDPQAVPQSAIACPVLTLRFETLTMSEAEAFIAGCTACSS